MRPTRRCVLLFACGIVVALLVTAGGAQLWPFWIVYLALCLLGCGADVLLGVPAGHVILDAEAPDVIYIGDRDALTVSLACRRRAGPFELLADLGDGLEQQDTVAVSVGEDGRAQVSVALLPRRRGVARIKSLWLRWSGPLGLVQRHRHKPLDLEIGVVPNVRAVRRAALRFFSARSFLSGLKVERYVGDGSEFESLREYVPGFDHRAMNWKATARHHKLICEEFRAERNHQVIVALDTGHLMADPLDGIPKLDHAINAALLLSYVCLRTGDRVGWFAFDQEPRLFIEPDGGTTAFRRLQRRSAEIEYSRGETNFTLGLMDLSLRLSRRSLVVVLSDFVDTVTAEIMLENVGRLSRRHLVLFVTLRDPQLDATVHGAPRTIDGLYRSVVGHDFVQEREVVLKKLTRLGVRCIDVPPGQVTTDLLNRYLDIKRRELF